MKLLDKIVAKNVGFIGNNVDSQNNFKYVFGFDDDVKVEMSYIEHLFQGKLTKKYLEMSTSYGCPAKCEFCASKNIKGFKQLKSSDLMQLLNFAISKHNLKDDYTVSLTGVGELFYTIDTVIEFMKQSLSEYPKLDFTLSTVNLTEDMLKKLEPFAPNIKYLQLTEVGDKARKILIPNMEKYSKGFEHTVDLLKATGITHRFNHVTIKDINDSETYFNWFADKLEPISKFTKVRIAQMNETDASRAKGLKPCSLESMKKFSAILNSKGIVNYLSYAPTDFKMNCGQLISELENECK